MSCNREERIEKLAVQILRYARNELLVALRFMDLALCKLTYQAADVARTATDGKHLYFAPQYIFQLYREGGYTLNHTCLHSVFHCVFYHPFIDPSVDQPLWDLACDIAVEGIIRELNVKQLETVMDAARAVELDALQKVYGTLTAEWLYKSFEKKPPSQKEQMRLQSVFQVDEHQVWYMEKESGQGGQDQDGQGLGQGQGQDSGGEDLYPGWEEISERIKVDLETASKDWGNRASSLMQNVQEVNRERYDYSDFLRKFAVLGEAMQINDDEFDYIFYTYGLSLYGNIPLIEPLEYKDVKRIREFVIAIDTSGELVQKFVPVIKSYTKTFVHIPTVSYIEVSRAGSEANGKKQMPSHTRLAHLLFPILSAGLPVVDFFVTVLRILPYAADVSEGASSGAVQPSDAERDPVQPPVGDRGRSQ